MGIVRGWVGEICILPARAFISHDKNFKILLKIEINKLKYCGRIHFHRESIFCNFPFSVRLMHNHLMSHSETERYQNYIVYINNHFCVKVAFETETATADKWLLFFFKQCFKTLFNLSF